MGSRPSSSLSSKPKFRTIHNKEDKCNDNTRRAITGDVEKGISGTSPAETNTLTGHNDHEQYQVHIENKSQLESNIHLSNEIDTTVDFKKRKGRTSQAGSEVHNVPHHNNPGKAVTTDFVEEAESMNNAGTQEAGKDYKTDHENVRYEDYSQRSEETEMEMDTTTPSRDEMFEQELPVENTQNPINETKWGDDKESFIENSVNKQNLDLVKNSEDADKSADNTDDAATHSKQVFPVQSQSETYNDMRDQIESSNVFGATNQKEPLRKDENLKLYRNEIDSRPFPDNSDKRADNIDDEATTSQQDLPVQPPSGTNNGTHNRKKDPLRKEDNLKFYRNEIASRPFPGSYVEHMLAWTGDYTKLETNHSYIQWLFPTPGSSGLNYSAQELFDYEAMEIIDDSIAHARFLRAYKMMLHFYGMKLEDEATGEIRRCEENWEKRFSHLNNSFHNYMRITRILTSLGEMGYDRFQKPLVRFIMAEALVNKELPNLDSNSMDYWIQAIKDGDEMFEMIKLRKDMKNNPEKYDKYGYPLTKEQPSNILTDVDAFQSIALKPQGTLITVEADSVDQYGNPITSDQRGNKQTDDAAQTTAGDFDPEEGREPQLTISTEDASGIENDSQPCQTVQTHPLAEGQEAYTNHESETGDENHREQENKVDGNIDYTDKGVLPQPGNKHSEALIVAHAEETNEDKTDGNVEEDAKGKCDVFNIRSNDEEKIGKSEIYNPDKDAYRACDKDGANPDGNEEQNSGNKRKKEQDSIAKGDWESVKESTSDLLETEVLAVKENCVVSATDSVSYSNADEDAHEKPTCKDIEDDHYLGENLEFYRNKVVKGPGRIIEEMLTVNFDTLHVNDDYWFWLFPVPKSDGITPNLSPNEAIAIKNDAEMYGRVLRAFKRALDFYGMELVDETPIAIRRRQSTWEVRYKKLAWH